MDTGCASVSGLVHIARCARERLTEQNRARDREYTRALRDRLRVRSIQIPGLCVRSSELANMHYKLISNYSVGEIKCIQIRFM